MFAFWTAPAPLAEEYPGEVKTIIENSPITPEAFLQLSPGAVGRLAAEHFGSCVPRPLSLGRLIFIMLFLLAAGNALVDKDTHRRLEMVGVLAILLVLLSPLVTTLQSLNGQAEGWNLYMGMLIPALSGLVACGGHTATAALFCGAFIGASNLFAAAIKLVLLPFIKIYIAVSAAGALWGQKSLSEACRLLLGGIRLAFKGAAVLLGVLLGAQSLLAGSKDTLALKAGKFLLANSIPIVGQAASDALGSVLAGLRLVKSTLAFCAVATLLASSGPIILEACLQYAVLCLSAVFARAVGLERCANVILSLSEGVKLCLSLLAIYFLLLFFCTVYMVLVGG